MISVGLPAFLWAGAAFALLPLALHFLTRRPPERQPLPTARFLRPDARTLLRFQRTPTDAALLALRLLFALLLGAAFADVSWQPALSGSAHVVLLDGGNGWGDAWPEALETARAAAASADVPGGPGVPGVADTAAERVILVYGSADGWYVVAPDELTTVEPGDGTTTFDEGLRALREVAAERRWSRVSAVWTTPGTWGQWTPGLAFRREALWPGAITWAGVAGASAPADARTPVDGAPRAGSAVAARPAVVETQPGDALLTRAIQALGGTIESGSVIDTAGAIRFAAEGVGGADERDAWVSAGGTLVTAATDRVPLPTGDARRVVTVRNDATALATAERTGTGCRVRVGDSWSAIGDEMGAGFPDFIRTLWTGCDDPGAGLALDSTAREQLTRPDLPLLVDTTDIGGSGVPLTRWILALLCLLLAAEVALTRGNRRTRVHPVLEGGT